MDYMDSLFAVCNLTGNSIIKQRQDRYNRG